MAEKKDVRRPKGDTGVAEIYTAKMGNPPVDPDMGSAPKPKTKQQEYSESVKARHELNVRNSGLTPKAYANKVNKQMDDDIKSGADTSYNEPSFKKGGKVSSASKRADGSAIRDKTRA